MYSRVVSERGLFVELNQETHTAENATARIEIEHEKVAKHGELK